VNDLVLLENHRGSQHRLVGKIDGVAFDGHIPVSEALGLHQHRNALLHLGHFFVWLHAAHSKTVTHARASLNLIGNAVNTTEFRRQMDLVITMLDDNQRLVKVCDVLLVHVVHVLSHTGHGAIVLKLLFGRRRFEIHAINYVGALVAPISNN